MLLSSRSFLPLLLVILQFFAPLLHAHTGQPDSHFGLHVPGLEAYGAPAGGVVADQPESNYAAAADCIVAVDDGFREKQPSSSGKHLSDGAGLALLPRFFCPDTSPVSIAEFPQPPLPTSRHRSPSPAPRAPPPAA
ncbi:hypothetical protein [Candidatus Methylomicrobium oryzae]|jgi:hypothetical protein|uniref:hypothetical protein n=1 Tax=Candidatus Methylomicrobium oryzae TaxID=2802053 RepID=UPI001922D416|nr:hypothetical protein [Methylomicrobium sp. RS1]MBL1262109.1 hypothetical protein [Methylomicrobium sp. RS1]